MFLSKHKADPSISSLGNSIAAALIQLCKQQG
jgi:hypothetical protein